MALQHTVSINKIATGVENQDKQYRHQDIRPIVNLTKKNDISHATPDRSIYKSPTLDLFSINATPKLLLPTTKRYCIYGQLRRTLNPKQPPPP